MLAPLLRLVVTGLGLALAAAPAVRAADLAAAARDLVGAGQGVRVEAEDGSVLVSQAAERAVHPASVSKVPTTLALLRKLGPGHRFETRFAGAGPLREGVLTGDLVVEADGDPFFVDENVLLVLLALREAGLARVSGGVALRGPLLFDWTDVGTGARLRRALAGEVPPAAWQAVREREGARAARPPGLAFGGPAAGGPAPHALVTHRSQPLVPLVKALNGFSNNSFGWFAGAAGGIGEVQSIARASVPQEMRGEIVLGDGAGEHPRNRMSPRAAVALLRALGAELAPSEHTLADVLPVAGIDEGTLRHRLEGPGERGHVVGKTGTYGDYGACALAGAIRTREHGVVYFAVLNHGVPIEPARRRQDAFVRALLAAFETEPWPYARDDAPAFTRAEVEIVRPRTAGGGG